ncbi:hypothetical protein G3T14_07000 [Methylobacterium sp. BTF04]|uniref:type VI secretion system protein TssA n=1 Tax=Methylobacterium sp. BTF04 TaxID=2708300 RepID=UPI0013D333B8|nr:type VI secretion system ImpA family N-terminal domain-containing protein [Methylobacterium sp. BTF04]NEU11876.1 hypothetical protein [Methylobacterium sp. BTF04]
MPLLLDPSALTEPLSAESPCGPDLEDGGDLDFLNGLSHAEGLLPTAFFSRDDEGRPQPFDRSGIDFGREYKALLALLARTRDIRILVLLARLAMLDRDLPGFAGALGIIASLLESRWGEVHPAGESGGFDLRNAILHALEDVPTVIMPLQHVVLAQSRRYGPITFRSVMVADGEVPAREGEPVLDRPGIERAVEETEPEALAARRDALAAVTASVRRIGAVTLAEGGYAGAVGLDRLGGLAGRIHDLLAGAAKPVVEAAEPEQDGVSAPLIALRQTGPLATVAQASAALAAAGLYLRSREPSSPAEVLVRQAQMLVGKSFLEVMNILVPANAADASIAIGANRALRLTFDQLAAVPDDASGGADQESEEADAASPPPVPATTRAEAMTLIRDAGAFFRLHEPSSPIPLLLDKAIGMADRDFLAILRDVLPDIGSA